MRLSAEDLIQLVGCAATAVKEAGVLIAQHDGREVLVQHKAGGGESRLAGSDGGG